MDIKGGIETILNTRKTKADDLKRRKEALGKFEQGVIDQIQVIQNATYEIEDPRIKDEYSSVVGSIYADPLMEAIAQMNERYDAAIERFSRDYISVATVGKERQGKSRFLRSVSSLDNQIIPAYDATSCTGATSVIWNDPQMEPGTVKAVITFRQPQELVELATAYINQIDPDFLKKPLTFSGIKTLNLSGLRQIIEDDKDKGKDNVNQEIAFNHLSKIVDHFKDIQSLFGKPPIITYNKEEIETYVAQNNGMAVGAGNKAYYSYLAVSRADIYCRFPADVGRLRLVDTIGIGTTQVGAEEAMLETVDKECDAAIVVTLPISGIQKDDIALYNSLRERFVGRDTSKWMFYEVNKKLGQTDNKVQAFRNDIYENNFAVADCRIVDNSNPEDVQNNFLIPLLEKLLVNMDEIDLAYLNELSKQEKTLKRAVEAFKDDLKDMDDLDNGNKTGMEAQKKGKECFETMAANLKGIVLDWREKKKHRNVLLWNRVQIILNGLDDLIPSAEKINDISANNGSKTNVQIWEMCLHYVRNGLTDQFIAIDDLLEGETRKFKNSLVDPLYRELKALTGSAEGQEDDEEVDKVKWLKQFIDEYLTGNEEYKQIEKAFDFLYKFEFNTRAQLIQEVRRQLYIINPICAEQYAQPEETFRDKNFGDQVYFYLTSRMSIIEDELRYHLAKLYRTPNEAFYAAAEEFYDRLVFSSDISGTRISDMGDVWGKFFQEFSTKLWQEMADTLEQVRKLKEAYETLKQTLEQFVGAEAAL